MTAAAHKPTPTIAAIAMVSDTPRPSVANPTLGVPHSDVAPFHLATPITDSSALHRRLHPLAHVPVHGATQLTMHPQRRRRRTTIDNQPVDNYKYPYDVDWEAADHSP
ncbi:hypothetical protein H4582DRAFT_2087922 [Lactarius indigo]|nr:hypothetical protein H4582DRAFT_2087922 [Lactarius indigo]